MIKVEFTGASAAEVMSDMKSFVAVLPGTAATAPVVAMKKAEAKKEEKPAASDTAGSAPDAAGLSEEDLKKERSAIRELVEKCTKGGEKSKAACRKVFADLKQVPEAKNVTSLLPENFAKVKESLSQIKVG